jgi:hypothetical protein
LCNLTPQVSHLENRQAAATAALTDKFAALSAELEEEKAVSALLKKEYESLKKAAADVDDVIERKVRAGAAAARREADEWKEKCAAALKARAEVQSMYDKLLMAFMDEKDTAMS